MRRKTGTSAPSALPVRLMAAKKTPIDEPEINANMARTNKVDRISGQLFRPYWGSLRDTSPCAPKHVMWCDVVSGRK